jgi:hypothetical protein
MRWFRILDSVVGRQKVGRVVSHGGWQLIDIGSLAQRRNQYKHEHVLEKTQQSVQCTFMHLWM